MQEMLQHEMQENADDVRAYNFGRAGQVSSDQMRAMTMVSDQLSRNLSNTLGAWLRTQTLILPGGTTQQSFGEFLTSLPDPSYLVLLHMEPLGGLALLELNVGSALTMIDLLLGGRGQTETIRSVTDIEDHILLSVLEVIVREINAAWDSLGLRFSLEKHEEAARLSRMMPGDERTFSIHLDLEMNGGKGRISLCIPTVVLNAMHRRLVDQRDQPRRHVDTATQRVVELMQGVRLRVGLRLPAVPIVPHVLDGLRVGSLLELPLPVYTPAEVVVEGEHLCSAVPVLRGDHRAAQMGAVKDESGVENMGVRAVPDARAAAVPRMQSVEQEAMAA